MKKLLHIIATPRGGESRTLSVSAAFLDTFRGRYPSCEIDELNVASEEVPSLTMKMITGKYVLLGGKDLPPEFRSAWDPIVGHIDRFLSAEGYLISTPMWNFGIPYPLKHYIDIILQPKYLFRYTEKGVEGLVKGRRMAVITSRGGDYSPGSPSVGYDHLEPYLRTAFGFAGITDIRFINAQPMDALGPDVRAVKIKSAKEAASRMAIEF